MTAGERDARKQTKVDETEATLIKARRALRNARKAGGYTEDLEKEVFAAQLANNVALREAGTYGEIMLTPINMKDGDPILNLAKRQRAA